MASSAPTELEVNNYPHTSCADLSTSERQQFWERLHQGSPCYRTDIGYLPSETFLRKYESAGLAQIRRDIIQKRLFKED